MEILLKHAEIIIQMDALNGAELLFLVLLQEMMLFEEKTETILHKLHAGELDAGILALQILSLNDKALEKKLTGLKRELVAGVRTKNKRIYLQFSAFFIPCCCKTGQMRLLRDPSVGLYPTEKGRPIAYDPLKATK